MKILIDADGCPVIDITIKIAKILDIDVIIISDTSHNFDKYGVQTITVSKGNDASDFEIVNKVEKKDIVVTQDYGLAAMILVKGACAINQNGIIYTNENIDQLLFSRHVSKKIRSCGGRVKGPKKRKKEDDISFEKSLIKLYESINT